MHKIFRSFKRKATRFSDSRAPVLLVFKETTQARKIAINSNTAEGDNNGVPTLLEIKKRREKLVSVRSLVGVLGDKTGGSQLVECD